MLGCLPADLHFLRISIQASLHGDQHILVLPARHAPLGRWRPWKVTVSRSGGIAGGITSATLDDRGMLVFPVWTGDEMITVHRQQQPADVAAIEAELATPSLSSRQR